MTMSDLENLIAGCFIALLTALDRDASDRAVETLFAFIADPHTPQYECRFYTDLLESIALVAAPPQIFEEPVTATVH
jgi:hypothetical protein